MRFGIVEDNREDFVALCRVLGPDHEISRWQSAEQVIAAFRTGGADELSMLFVDCNLPGVDGIELVRQLRTFPGGDEAKIAMFSGSTDPDVSERALEAGVDRFETKGASIDDFKASVARCLTVVKDAPDLL
ncbi:MAG: response regulator [Solirubrobacteraceae bacterium]|nr:response regulator [Solirubrobacteraceae bacterium]